MQKEPFRRILSVSTALTFLLTVSLFFLQISEDSGALGIRFPFFGGRHGTTLAPIVNVRHNVDVITKSLPVPSAEAAASVVFSNGEDNQITGTTGNDMLWNRGGFDTIAAGRGGNSSVLQRSLIKFDLSNIPAGSTVSSAALLLTCVGEFSSTDYAITAYPLSRSWSEGTAAVGTYVLNTNATWTHSNYPTTWGTPGADNTSSDRGPNSIGTAIVTNCVNASVSIPINTATIEGWINNPATNYGILLKGDETQNNTIKNFASSEHATVSYHPQLSIVYDSGGTPPSDTTPPALSGGTPTGTLVAGTTQTSIGVTTDEVATCKYGTTANTSYAALPNSFTTAGAISHSVSVTGLANGSSYTYYVRCQDAAGNANTSDYTISFSIASTSQSPVCGNGIVESGEQCDGANLGGGSCTSLGYSGGTLSCSSCQFITTSCTTTPTSGSVFHVRTDGSDTTCNGSANAASASAPNCAFKTVQKAVNSLTAAGNRIIIHAGAYPEYVQIGSGQPNGTQQNPIIVEGDPSVPRSSIIIDGSGFDGAFLVNGSGGSTTKAYYIFQHFSFRTGRLQGMELGTFTNGYAANMVARDLEVHSINFVQSVPYNSRVITASTWTSGPYGNSGNMLIEDVVIDNAENGGQVASGVGIFATSGHTVIRKTNIKDTKALGRVGNSVTLEFNTWEFSNCDSDGGCIQLYNGYGLLMRYNTIRVKNNIAAQGRVMETRCCAAGTSAASSPDFASAFIYNNVFDYLGTSEATAITVDHGTQYISIRNNIFKGFKTTAGSSGAWTVIGANCSKYEFKYNALYNSNLTRATSGCGTVFDPTNLANTATIDFNTSTYVPNLGSRVINVGDPILSVPVGGGIRTDIGAYESGAGTTWAYDFQIRDATTSNTPTLDWGTVSTSNINLNAPYGFTAQTGFQCQIDSTTTFDSQGRGKPLYDSGAPNTNTAATCQSTTSLPNGNYYGRIRFRNEDPNIPGYTGIWSDHYYKFSIGAASIPVCGNGIVESSEQCDGQNLNGASCTTQGFSSGTLSCASCQFVTTQCVQASAQCGNAPLSGTPDGFGSATTGGGSNAVVCVTNLNDSGPGSLREALSGSNRRVYFNVGGTINLASKLNLLNRQNVTIDGSTAPALGVTIRGQQFEIKDSSNVIVRHIRSRDTNSTADNIPGIVVWCPNSACSNFWLDHLSVSRASDDSILVYESASDVTISNSIIYDATSVSDPSPEAMLISGTSGRYANRVSVHHTVITKNYERNPSISGDPTQGANPTTVDFRNNIVHNWGNGGYGTRVRWNGTGNIVKNVYYSANSPTAAVSFETPYRPVHISGNYEQSGVSINSLSTSAAPITASAIVENSITELRQALGSNPVLDGAGAYPRDSVDTAAIAAVAADIVAPVADTTPPVRSNGQPTGSLPATTTQVVMSLSTDENATCKYATMANAPYSLMTSGFSTTGTNVHSILLSGLTSNTTYTYYVKCIDAAASPNANTSDYSISFSIAADTMPPVRSNGFPTGTLPVGTTQTTLSLATDETATCRFSATSGTSYTSGQAMTVTGGTAHSMQISNLSNGSVYTYYVRCQDANGNANMTDFPISFTVASTLIGTLAVNMTPTPASGNSPLTASLTATVTGTELGTITYTFYCDRSDTGTDITTPFDVQATGQTAMTYTASNTCAYTTTGIHTAKVIVQRGAAPNAESRATITVNTSQIADTVPPIISITTPAGNTAVSGSMIINAAATDNMGVTGVLFKVDGTTLGTEVTQAPYTITWDTRAWVNTTHSITAIARDAAGNLATSAVIIVTVNNATNQCIEQWTCDAWSTCVNGVQTRACTELNNCGTTVQRPALTQSCSSPTGSSGGGGTAGITGSTGSTGTTGQTGMPGSTGTTSGTGNTSLTPDQIQGIVDAAKKRLRAINAALVNRLLGRILLQVQSHGEAWYLDPLSKVRYYLANGEEAYEALRTFGLGITDADIAKIPVGIESRFQETDTDGDGLSDKMEEGLGTDIAKADTDGDGFNDGTEVSSGHNPLGSGTLPTSATLLNRLKGRIVLQVLKQGQAWYISPVDGKRYYLHDGEAAYQIMRFLSLGISDADLEQIGIGELR